MGHDVIAVGPLAFEFLLRMLALGDVAAGVESRSPANRDALDVDQQILLPAKLIEGPKFDIANLARAVQLTPVADARPQQSFDGPQTVYLIDVVAEIGLHAG